LGATGATFLALSGWVLVTRRDFSFMGGFLFAGMVIAILAGLAAMFFQMPALGLAVSADFRVARPESKVSANFTRLGFHPGFGLTATLPRLIGQQKTAMMFYTGRRIAGEEAFAMGLADVLVPKEQLRDAAMALAQEIAISAPIAVVSTRATMRQGLVDLVRAAVNRESIEQDIQRKTEDFKEGVAAMSARREPVFQGR
ncbi:MAG TPA: enoyl-CoA hydratase-related protein, partial [Acidimicrobiales bacterium]|nr:enoyl-CoA hydratase-related protein [Acidimicrobiales bacterium]